jgi:hypothetical protein
MKERRAQMMGANTLRLFLLSHSLHTMYFGATIQFYKDTIVHLVTNTRFTSSLATCRSGVPRTLPGGSSEVDCSKSLRQSVAPPNVQSSFRTSSQISSINRRYTISIISNAISRSSLSVGIRPAPKSDSQSVRARSFRFNLHGCEALRRGVRN